MKEDEKAELIDLFSELTGRIHRLSQSEAQALMDVDVRMSRSAITLQDLERLREIKKAQG